MKRKGRGREKGKYGGKNNERKKVWEKGKEGRTEGRKKVTVNETAIKTQ